MTKKERAAAVTELLKSVYPEAVCALHYTHDYELLFATRLSAQCTDARVNIVTEKLFKQFPTLQSFADASEEEIAEAIKTCGLFRTKARDLKACAMMLIANYGGRVPDTWRSCSSSQASAARPPTSSSGIFSANRHCVRYALHPFVQPAGLRQEREGPGQGGERPEKAARTRRSRPISATGWCCSAASTAPPAVRSVRAVRSARCARRIPLRNNIEKK